MAENKQPRWLSGEPLTDQFASSEEPIQPQLSNKAFKYLYSWDELRQRTKKVKWIYEQIVNMMERGEKIEEIENMMDKMSLCIKDLAPYYKSRYQVKLGYLQENLKDMKVQLTNESKNDELKPFKKLKYEESTKTIRSVPENYWIASVKNDDVIFDSWDGAIKGRVDKKYVKNWFKKNVLDKNEK